MKIKLKSISDRRAALKKSESEILKKIDNQSGTIENKLQSNAVKLAIAAGGLLLGFTIYKLVTGNKSMGKKSKKAAKLQKDSLVASVVQQFVKSAVPYVIDQLTATQKNDTRSTHSK